MPAMLMDHTKDPAKEIMDRVKNTLKDIELFGNQVLLGVYERPEKTKSGLYLADTTRQEDQHQGKSAICLAKGPAAFVSDSTYNFRGQTVEVGDWVAIFVSDGRRIVLQDAITGEKQLCRIIEDQFIRLKIPAPDVVY